MNKIWRDVYGYEGLYQVSNYGEVKSLRNGKILKPSNNTFGYLSLNLWKNGEHTSVRVHRLVARAFPEICGDWFEGCEVGHRDCVRTNNNANNLYICTHKENCNNELTKINLSKVRSKENHPLWGKHHKESSIEKMKQYIKTEEHCKRISESKKGKINIKLRKPVIQFTLDGDVVNMFNSIKEASSETGIHPTGITMCCKGNHKHAGGFIWKYKH